MSARTSSFPATSVENHDLLVKLGTEVNNMGSAMREFMETTRREQERLHERITETDRKSREAMEAMEARSEKGLKEVSDNLGTVKLSEASRGKVTATQVGILITAFIAIGGLVHFDTSIQISSLLPALTRDTSDIAELHAKMRAADVASEVSGKRLDAMVELAKQTEDFRRELAASDQKLYSTRWAEQLRVNGLLWQQCFGAHYPEIYFLPGNGASSVPK